jgi:5'-nucleotidase
MHILVTNDDGVLAPGLLALAQAMQNFGEVSIMAPDRNWSGGGHVKTLDRPLRIKEVTLANGSLAYASDGAPSDCVALALLGFFPEKIDLVVSGINPMPNLGHDVTYSGTVTAAMESVIWGVPAIAFSVNSNESHLDAVDYSPSIDIIQQIIEKILQHRIPAGILLNVNLPYLPKEEIKGVRVTRQGLRVYNDRLDRRVDPRGREYFWIGGDKPSGLPENGTDIGALDGGYVSITPLQLDLTAYPALHMISQWHWEQPDSNAVAMEPFYKVIATPAKVK